MHVTTVNVTDWKGTLEIYEQYPKWTEAIETILTNGGYTKEKFQKKIQKLLHVDIQVAKRSELHQFQIIPKSLFRIYGIIYTKKDIFYDTYLYK